MTLTPLRPADPVPTPPRTRWMPSRAGILNVWRYFGEVFEFHQGRLLLRGANGSGKSKALELLLPFLFDASLRAHRLSTFGTSERTMHWNLMGDGATGATRVGYVWVEFTLGAGPDAQWFVCGARLQASKHTSTATADYFTLHRRVGSDEFVTDSGQPLTRAALSERLGPDGVLHDSPSSYRDTVRTVLFGGISEQRYESLILALLQLRTPKLSQRLDPSLLSSLLSRALPPLGETELAELAEGFERLDRQREDLKRLDEEVEAAQRLAVRQQAYARRVLRAAAAGLVSATSELTARSDAARESERQLAQARDDRGEAARRSDEAAATASRLQVDLDALHDRAEYKEGRDALRRLEELRQRAAAAQKRAGEARRRADRARSGATTDATACARAQQEIGGLAERVDALRDGAASDAARAGLAGVADELGRLAGDEPDRAVAFLEGAVVSRHRDILQVRGSISAWEKAVDTRENAEAELEEAREVLERALAARRTAEQGYATAVQERADRLRLWLEGCRELRADPDVVVALVEDETALRSVVDAAVTLVGDQLAEAAAAARQSVDDATGRQTAVRVELDAVRAATHVPPLPPATRTAERRRSAGAPFWELVDFADGVPPSTAAAVEAALQAAGLLDAWVTPEGRIEGHDLLLDPGPLAPASGRSLADVLRPDPGDHSVTQEQVRSALAVIAYGERLPLTHPAAIGADGTWRLGPARGSWSKDDAEHIGAAARERARARRIAELRADLEAIEAEVTAALAEAERVARRRRELAAERARLPGRGALDAAALELQRSELAAGQADEQVARWTTRVTHAGTAVVERQRDLHAVAARTALPTRTTDLDALAAALDAYRSVAQRWLGERRRLDDAECRAQELVATAARSAESATDQEAAATGAEEEAVGLARAVETLNGSIGQGYRMIADRITALGAELLAARTAQERHRQEVHRRELAIAELAAEVRISAQQHDAAIARRDVAAERVRTVCRGSLPADAGLAEPEDDAGEGVRATLETARRIAAQWPAIPHEPHQVEQALARLAEQVHAARDVLVGADLELEAQGEHQVLTAAAHGIRTGTAGLLAAVSADAARARDDITAAERELFEATLTGDTRRHLADRIRRASALVDAMNQRLDEVRTASDVAVRLDWQVDPELPASTRAARELLLRDPARLDDTDRAALHRFLRERVDHARATDSATSWEQQLAEVFDYTAWHRFVVRIDRGRGEGWQVLTKKLHGALSGGEKAIALHLPLFAAVAAHYESEPRSPRIILLDEVFVGVDEVNRGQVFGLLASLDLDLVLTSDHEWCAYSELDGIAVHQLVGGGGEGDDAVTTARFVWTGEDWLDPEIEP